MEHYQRENDTMLLRNEYPLFCKDFRVLNRHNSCRFLNGNRIL